MTNLERSNKDIFDKNHVEECYRRLEIDHDRRWRKRLLEPEEKSTDCELQEAPEYAKKIRKLHDLEKKIGGIFGRPSDLDVYKERIDQMRSIDDLEALQPKILEKLKTGEENLETGNEEMREGSLSIGVKSKEAQELSSGQRSSDTTTSQPFSPYSTESLREGYTYAINSCKEFFGSRWVLDAKILYPNETLYRLELRNAVKQMLDSDNFLLSQAVKDVLKNIEEHPHDSLIDGNITKLTTDLSHHKEILEQLKYAENNLTVSFNGLLEIHEEHYNQICDKWEKLNKDEKRYEIKKTVEKYEILQMALKDINRILAIDFLYEYADLQKTTTYLTTYLKDENNLRMLQQRASTSQFAVFQKILNEASRIMKDNPQLENLVQQYDNDMMNDLTLMQQILEKERTKANEQIKNIDVYSKVAIDCSNKYKEFIQEKFTPEQVNILNQLMKKVQDSESTVVELSEMDTANIELTNIEDFLEAPYPVEIEKFMKESKDDTDYRAAISVPLHYDPKMTSCNELDVIWAVNSRNDIFIVPQWVPTAEFATFSQIDIDNPTPWFTEEEDIQAKGKALLSLSLIGERTSWTEACLLNIESTGDQADLERGKEAFKQKGIFLVDDILQALHEQEVSEEQTPLASPETCEPLQASEQARELWDTLTGKQPSLELENKTFDINAYPDSNTPDDRKRTEYYTKGELARAGMTVELAAELSPLVKELRRHWATFPCKGGNVVSGSKTWSLFIPVDAPPFKTVLSIIGQMDQWQEKTDNKNEEQEKADKYAADLAAIAINQIEACRKLGQPMPSDMPPLEDLNLHDLAQQYEETYNQAPKQQQEAAREHISTLYAQRLWAKLKGDEWFNKIEVLLSNDQKKAQLEVAKSIFDLAGALSHTVRKNKDLLNTRIVPECPELLKFEAVYDAKSNRLWIPPDSNPPLKAVLSIISEMDRAKYEWAGSTREGKEKYAQAAATAIRLIEACRKLNEPMPSDLPLLEGLNLQELTQQYEQAYKKPLPQRSDTLAAVTIQPDTTTSQDAARQRIYDFYAQEHGFDKLGLPKADIRNYQVYDRDIPEESKRRLSIKEIRWKFFCNTECSKFPAETEQAEAKEIKLAKMGDPNLEELIRDERGKLIWIITLGEEIIFGSRFTTHAVVAGNRPILDGGEIRFKKDPSLSEFSGEFSSGSHSVRIGSGKYVFEDKTHGSGHYVPEGKTGYSTAIFHRHGLRLNNTFGARSIDPIDPNESNYAGRLDIIRVSLMGDD